MIRGPRETLQLLSRWVRAATAASETYVSHPLPLVDWRTFIFYVENLEQRISMPDPKPVVDMAAMARADVALTLMIASPTYSGHYKFWVEVVKNRYGGTSNHAFATLQDAIDFMEEFTQ